MPDRPDQPPHVRSWQQILNEHWPPNPVSFRRRDPIPVRVRVVWERDGEEYVRGLALRWDANHVYVEWRDSMGGRAIGNGVWLKPSDVFRAGSVGIRA